MAGPTLKCFLKRSMPKNTRERTVASGQATICAICPSVEIGPESQCNRFALVRGKFGDTFIEEAPLLGGER